MLKYSFMSSYSNCSYDEIMNLIKTTDKPFKYTYGLSYRHPTTDHVPMTREDAIKELKSKGFTDVTEHEDYIHINSYSDNDMW